MGITNPTEEYFKDGLWGWIGSRWRKISLVFGYNTYYLEALENLNAGAGDNTLAGSAVPAGELRIVTNIDAANADTNITALNFQIVLAATEYHIAGLLTPSKKEGANVQGFWPLPTDSHIEAFFEGCTAGDDIHFHIIGYKMPTAA